MKKHIFTITTCTALMIFLMAPTTLAGFFIKGNADEQNFSYETSAGKTIDETITVTNTGPGDLTLLVYGADAEAGGQIFAAKSNNEKQNTVGLWIKLPENVKEIKNGETITVPFTIDIPATTPPGDYAGAIAVSTQRSDKDASAIGVISIQRVIFPVYIKIPGEEKNGYEWTTFELNKGRKNPSFLMSYKNTGNTILSAEGEIDVTDANTNTSVQKIKIVKNRFYQNTSGTADYQFDTSLAQNITNKYKAVATVTFSQLDVKTGKETVLGTETKELVFDVNHFEFLWYVLTGLIVIIGVFAVQFALKKYALSHSTSYTAEENDTLEKIAEKSGASWKSIAKLNKMHPPYAIKKGDKILIPKK